MGRGKEGSFKRRWSNDQDGYHAHTNLFSVTEHLMILKLGIQHRVLRYYKIPSNDDPG